MKSLLFLFSLALSLNAFAGKEGGGGGAFVCRNSANEIMNSELLDLWEGREIIGWNIPYSNDPVETQLHKAIDKLKNVDTGLYQLVLKELAHIQSTVRYFPADVTISAPDDAMNQYQKTGCPLEGMMYYDGNFDRLGVNKTIFDHLLNNTNVAAAWVHETIYKIWREEEAQSDSRQARRLTACLFATDDCMGLKSASTLPAQKTRYFCQSKDFDFYAVKDGQSYSLWVSRLKSSRFVIPIDMSNWFFSSGDAAKYPIQLAGYCGVLCAFGYMPLVSGDLDTPGFGSVIVAGKTTSNEDILEDRSFVWTVNGEPITSWDPAASNKIDATCKLQHQ